MRSGLLQSQEGMARKTYSYARLGRWDLGVVRILGDGLGNLLFPWARSIVCARKHGLVPIAPTWPQIKAGPILRNEPDKRFYAGLFDCSPEYVRGLHKLYLLATQPRVAEDEFIGSGERAGSGEVRSGIVVFSGMNGFFERILPDHEVVWRELIAMTRPQHKRGLTFNFANSISAHVRLSDFKVGRQETDMAWFVDTVTRLRSEVGARTRLLVFSDGSDEELGPLLDLGNANRVSFGSSIADILALSRSRVLVGSRGSTFSMWASYLGRMPVVWPGGKSVQRLYPDAPEAELVRGLGEALPAPFVSACQASIKR
jgi:hypothetical protein